MLITPGLIFHCFVQLDGSSSFFLLDSKFSILLLKKIFFLKVVKIVLQFQDLISFVGHEDRFI